MKDTASFLCADFCISFWDCLRSCLLSVLLAVVQLSVRLPLCQIGSEENDCDVCYWCDDVGQTVNILQTVTKDIQYNDMMLSVMIYELYSLWDDIVL